MAAAIRHALSPRTALTRTVEDGTAAIDNGRVERAMRPVAVGRKDWLFVGSDVGGRRAAAIRSLVGTATRNGPDLEATLRHVPSWIADHAVDRVGALLFRDVDMDQGSTAAA